MELVTAPATTTRSPSYSLWSQHLTRPRSPGAPSTRPRRLRWGCVQLEGVSSSSQARTQAPNVHLSLPLGSSESRAQPWGPHREPATRGLSGRVYLSLIYAVLTASPAGPDASPQTPELGRTTFPLLIVLGIKVLNQHGWRGPDIKQKKNRSPEGYKPIMISVLFSPLAKLYKYTPLKTRGS